MKPKLKIVVAALAGLLGHTVFITACQPDPDVLKPAKEVRFYIPEGWPAPFFTFEDNAWSKESFELGKKLFFDPRLSSDYSTSCESCHQQFSGFAQVDHDVSHGVNNRLGTRNSQPIFNMAWHNTFFWDGAVNHLERQPISPFENPVEMDLPMSAVVKRVDSLSEYHPLFEKAYGSQEINSQKILKALAIYMVSIISDNSKYDKIVRGEPGISFTVQELEGKRLFEAHCNTCHKPPLFTDLNFRNNGLKPSMVNDSGRYKISLQASDMYKFKVPSLRNLKYTAPYFHDGRTLSIDDVLNHYHSGIVASPTLDPLLKNGIQFSSAQREQLKAFLNTLNDEDMVRNTGLVP